MSIKDWLDFLFKDKRFGWRFKIANLIMGDYLHNYLAVGVSIPLENAKRFYKHESECKHEINKALESLNELYDM